MSDYRDARPPDGPALAGMARRAFIETFGTLYRSSDLAQFLDRSFGADGLPSQLDDPAYQVRLALDSGAIVGFAKLGPVAFPGDWPAAIELHQLYVLASHLGAGVGPELMRWALATARRQGYRRMVLSVFVDNHRAQRFYARHGFREVGRHAFRVGEQIDDDRIWSLDL